MTGASPITQFKTPSGRTLRDLNPILLDKMNSEKQKGLATLSWDSYFGLYHALTPAMASHRSILKVLTPRRQTGTEIRIFAVKDMDRQPQKGENIDDPWMPGLKGSQPHGFQ